MTRLGEGVMKNLVIDRKSKPVFIDRIGVGRLQLRIRNANKAGKNDGIAVLTYCEARVLAYSLLLEAEKINLEMRKHNLMPFEEIVEDDSPVSALLDRVDALESNHGSTRRR